MSTIYRVKNDVMPAVTVIGAAAKLVVHKVASISPGVTVTVKGDPEMELLPNVIAKIYVPAN